MRFLHLADLHIGKQVNGYSLIADQRFVLEQVLAMLKVHSIDALVLAGDIYDKSSPSEEAVKLLDWFLSQAAAAGVPVLAIPGNHDSAERLAFAQSLLAQQGVHLPAVFHGTVGSVELADEDGPITFWLLPFIRPLDAKRALPDLEDIGQSYTQAVKAVLDRCPLNPDQRNVVLSHQFVTFNSQGPDRADEEINLGGVDNVDASVYDAFDYVALGHVHRPQRIGRDTARYAGSLLKYSFSEAVFDKSAVLVELGPKSPGDAPGACVTFQLLPLEPLHDMREIKGPLDALTSPEVVAGGNAQDYIHAILTDETPHLDALARLRACYPNLMLMDYDSALTSVVPGALPEISPDDIDPQEAFATFFRQQAGHEPTPQQADIVGKLLQRALEHTEGGHK